MIYCYSMQVVSWIITIWFIGSFVIFVLARALGGEASILESNYIMIMYSLEKVNFQCLQITYCIHPCVDVFSSRGELS